MFRLGHVSDPHVRCFAGARLMDFIGKRAIGGLNIALVRRRKHRMDLLAALGADLKLRSMDHLVVTGDLSNLSLESEWLAARRWLEECGRSPQDTTVFPGNHDAYVPSVVKQGSFARVFSAYHSPELQAEGEAFPFVRMRGPLALICLNSAVPTGDLGAWGMLGEAQLRRLEALLQAPEVVSRMRVVLLHHPPVMHRPPENRNLRDREAFTNLLARVGADLVLHGHDHRDELSELRGPGGAVIPCVGVGSASYCGRPERTARYNVYEIEDRSVTVVSYGYDLAAGRMWETGRKSLRTASPASVALP